MKYHRFWIGRSINVIVVSSTHGEHIWLSFVIAERLRNGGFSQSLAQYIITKLSGVHHIHWPPGLRTFQTLSKQLEWRSNGTSRFFDRCRAAIAYSEQYPPLAIAPFLDLTLNHTLSTRRPSLPTINSRDASWIISEIRSYFTSVSDDAKARTKKP